MIATSLHWTLGNTCTFSSCNHRNDGDGRIKEVNAAFTDFVTDYEMHKEVDRPYEMRKNNNQNYLESSYGKWTEEFLPILWCLLISNPSLRGKVRNPIITLYLDIHPQDSHHNQIMIPNTYSLQLLFLPHDISEFVSWYDHRCIFRAVRNIDYPLRTTT